MVNAKKIWDELKLPPLTPQPPWHGYSLGDWSDLWTRFADAPSPATGAPTASRPSPAARAA